MNMNVPRFNLMSDLVSFNGFARNGFNNRNFGRKINNIFLNDSFYSKKDDSQVRKGSEEADFVAEVQEASEEEVE